MGYRERNIRRSVAECKRRKLAGICRCCDQPVCGSLVFCEKNLKQHSNKCRERIEKLLPGVWKFRATRARKSERLLITKEEFVAWYDVQDKACCYCGIEEVKLATQQDKKKRKLTVDRMDNTLPYQQGNICLACFRCNSLKNDFFTHEQWKSVAAEMIRPRLQEYHRLA